MSSETDLNMALRQGASELGLELAASAYEQLCAYAALLLKWNRVYNLTALRDASQVLSHHLLDSLAVVPAFVGVTHLADVGSGGGLPGIVLAIVRPELKLTSIEVVDKKASFQQQVRIELGLSNFWVLRQRVEQLRLTAGEGTVPEHGFDAIISRAFAGLGDFVRLSRHLLCPGGYLLAMKGVYPQAEITALPDDVRVAAVQRLQVPGLAAERHLITLELI